MATQTVFTLLGTGSSGGVPRIGNLWGACDPDNPKNRRTRCSMLVERGSVFTSDQSSPGEDKRSKTTVLIDTGPDMREQLLSSSVTYLDGELLTHAHADHIAGLDDLRQLAITHKEVVNVHMDEPTAKTIKCSFGYCFHQAEGSSYPAICKEHAITVGTAIQINGEGGTITAEPFRVNHGDITALGFRVANLVYLPDVKTVTETASMEILKNTDTLILDALRYTSHPTHMNVEEALAFIEQTQPKRAILTNMHVDIDYQSLTEQLPDNVEAGYDGMKISFDN